MDLDAYSTIDFLIEFGVLMSVVAVYLLFAVYILISACCTCLGILTVIWRRTTSTGATAARGVEIEIPELTGQEHCTSHLASDF